MNEKYLDGSSAEQNINGDLNHKSSEMVGKLNYFICILVLIWFCSTELQTDENLANYGPQTSSHSLNTLVHAVLSDKKPEEVPIVSLQMLAYLKQLLYSLMVSLK